MNRKQLLILVVIGLVAGGLGLYLYKSDQASYKTSEQTSAKTPGDFPINDVAGDFKQRNKRTEPGQGGRAPEGPRTVQLSRKFFDISEFVRKAC
jgi:hypothetical protein